MKIWMNLKGKYEVIQEGAVLQVKLNFTCLEKNLNELTGWAYHARYQYR